MALAPSPKKLAVAEPQSCWNSLLSIELYPHIVRRDAESFPERPMKIREIVEADCISYIAHLAIATRFVQQKSASQ
jgi:hypothetical protein